MDLKARLLPVFLLLCSPQLISVRAQPEANYTEVCYPPCGCFDNAPPFDDRPIPDSPEDQQIRWDLYTQENPLVPVEIHWEDVPDLYDPSKPTKFLIHGWRGITPPDGEEGVEPYLDEIRDEFLLMYDYNIIMVEWETGAGDLFYPQSASNARVTGACSAFLAYNITDIELVHCIGISLGGQACGYMGYETDGEMARATGLDAAGVWFDVNETEVRLDKTDAQFVDTIHTNVDDSLITLGMGKPVGHVDFYPNGGGRQPGCDNFYCDHTICTTYFATSIAQCEFEAYPCDSEEDADAGLCNTCNDGCQRMGYYSDTIPANGTFYLTTLPEHPHC